MSKKHDLPAMPFYVGDWLKCPEVRALTPAARGIWMDMLCYMWESTERGYLTLNGNPIPIQSLANMVGIAKDLLVDLLAEMLGFAVYSIRDDGAIFCRRMARDEEIRLKRADAGKKGGFATQFAKAKGTAKSKHILEDEDENEIEDESSSPDPIWRECTTYLVESLKKIGMQPKEDSASLSRWDREVRLMIQQDGRKPGDIKLLVDECREHGDAKFSWSKNIRSMATLRQRWNENKIWVGMNRKSPDRKPPGRRIGGVTVL